MGRIQIQNYDRKQILNEQECLNRYDELVKEIEPIIAEVNINDPDGFDKWEEVNKQIQEKEKELNPCREKGFLSIYLYGDEDIQVFNKKCTENPECPSSPLNPKNIPAPLKSKSVGPCEEGDRCNEGELKTTAHEVKAESRDGALTSNAVKLEGQDSVEPGPNIAEGEESKQEQVLTQTQVGSNTHGSDAGPDNKASDAMVGQPSDKPGEREDQPQVQSAAAPPENGELDDPPSSASAQCSSKGDNDLTCAPEETTVDANPFLINPHRNNSLGSSLPGDKAVVTETSGGASSTEEGSASGEMSDSNSSPTGIKSETYRSW
ncbi:unnamed protein product [Plasmodium vivax]|uniref:(malaria parasite P. vivax) hypothetical protein n=1 Tax=Plasmodium vivax TaxID=5855 RepID=A0A1G4GR86_PLAVI|nr:unnamed protein product [Plasmodium vivax]SCO65049.1 hypothetical protein PVT01_010022400 [Plasmodium vivax]